LAWDSKKTLLEGTMVFKCKLSEFNNKIFIFAQYALTFTPNHINIIFTLSLWLSTSHSKHYSQHMHKRIYFPKLGGGLDCEFKPIPELGFWFSQIFL